MQVIGLCRFSYPGIGGFQVEHASIQERIAFLYAPRRMEERFRYFETLTLPALRAQSDPDFTFLIVVGESLPAEYRSRLEALVRDLPQAVIQAHAPGPHRAVMKAAINSVRASSSEPCLQFRLDDDDAVATSFVARLRHEAKNTAFLLEDNRHIALDFSRGFIARPGSDGLAVHSINKPLWTAGLALMFRAQVELTVMNFAHHRVAKFMPVRRYDDVDMMLRGFSDQNDSRQKPDVRAPQLTPLDSAGAAHFLATYNIDAAHVSRVFSTPYPPSSTTR